MLQLPRGLLLKGHEQEGKLMGRGMAVDQVGWGLHHMQNRQRCRNGLRQLDGGGHCLVGGRGEIRGRRQMAELHGHGPPCRDQRRNVLRRQCSGSEQGCQSCESWSGKPQL